MPGQSRDRARLVRADLQHRDAAQCQQAAQVGNQAAIGGEPIRPAVERGAWLMAGHFGVPFFYLMGRDVKRREWTLAVGGVWLLAMHFVDLYWQVMPTLHPEGFRPSALDVAAFVAIGGCFVATASWLMRRQALVPMRDPRLAESLAFENV